MGSWFCTKLYSLDLSHAKEYASFSLLTLLGLGWMRTFLSTFLVFLYLLDSSTIRSQELMSSNTRCAGKCLSTNYPQFVKVFTYFYAVKIPTVPNFKLPMWGKIPESLTSVFHKQVQACSAHTGSNYHLDQDVEYFQHPGKCSHAPSFSILPSSQCFHREFMDFCSWISYKYTHIACILWCLVFLTQQCKVPFCYCM